MAKSKKNNTPSTKKKLSILIDRGGLSFCTSKPKEKVVSKFVEKKFESPQEPGKILDEIKTVFKENNINSGTIGKVQVVYSNQLYSFVPKTYFDKKQLSDYLKFNVKILENDFIAYDELTALDLCNVYIPYANINNYFFENFGAFEYKHATSVLAENVLNQTETANEKTAFVNVYTSHFDLLVAQNKKLVFCNSFSFETPEDFLYYILFTAEQLKMDPEHFLLKFSGNISPETDYFKICYTYIRNCSFLEKEKGDEKGKETGENQKTVPHFILRKTHQCA